MTVGEPLSDYVPTTVVQESIDKLRSISELDHLRYKDEPVSVISNNNREVRNDGDREHILPNEQPTDEDHHNNHADAALDTDDDVNGEPLIATTRYMFQDDSPRRLQIQSPLMSILTASSSPKFYLENDNIRPGRRIRTTFSTEQKQALELAFEKTPYPDSIQREILAAKHQIPEARVQVLPNIQLFTFYLL